MKLICLECGKEFEKEAKYVKRGEGKFCSLSCSTRYLNNSRVKIKLTCQYCQKEYDSPNKNSRYCSRPCAAKARILRNGISGGRRSALSSKINKAITTGTSECFICGWNLTTCDIHHIIEKCNGGTDDFENLTVLCPNCHRLVQRNLLQNPPTVSSRIGLSLHPQ